MPLCPTPTPYVWQHMVYTIIPLLSSPSLVCWPCQIVYLVDAGAVKPLCDMLAVKDMKVGNISPQTWLVFCFAGGERQLCGRALSCLHSHNSVSPPVAHLRGCPLACCAWYDSPLSHHLADNLSSPGWHQQHFSSKQVVTSAQQYICVAKYMHSRQFFVYTNLFHWCLYVLTTGCSKAGPPGPSVSFGWRGWRCVAMTL